jgi:hypothetical protein
MYILWIDVGLSENAEDDNEKDCIFFFKKYLFIKIGILYINN